jgi:D-sedoheptulose 7-phosphate isomerase
MAKNGSFNALPVLREYLRQVREALAAVSEEEVLRIGEALLRARQRGSTVYLLGNGGSASTASHAANDLTKTGSVDGGPALRTVSLPDNVSMLTAWANDTSFENVFSAQLEALLRPGDLVVAISGSGNSPNVLGAVETAREMDALSVGLTGFAGGRLREMADLSVVVPALAQGPIEDVHLILVHVLTEILKRAELEPAAVPAVAVGAGRGNDGEEVEAGRVSEGRGPW